MKLILDEANKGGYGVGAFNVNNDFRQITLFKNLTLSDSGSAGPISQLAEARANRKLTLQGAIGSISADQKITGDSGTVAWIDQVDIPNRSGRPNIVRLFLQCHGLRQF